MTLKIEAGKYYRTRDGRKVGPIEENGKVSLHVWRDKIGTGDSWRHDGRHNAMPSFDLIAEWTEPMTETPHIITSANGRTYDLTALETPFGLLPEDVQRALRAWPHGREIYHDSHWSNCVEEPVFCKEYACRARPAPKTAEHVLWWHEGDGASFRKFPRDTHRLTIRYTGETHRLTIRYTGDTLPYGTYTGPDGATITVEKAQ